MKRCTAFIDLLRSEGRLEWENQEIERCNLSLYIYTERERVTDQKTHNTGDDDTPADCQNCQKYIVTDHRPLNTTLVTTTCGRLSNLSKQITELTTLAPTTRRPIVKIVKNI